METAARYTTALLCTVLLGCVICAGGNERVQKVELRIHSLSAHQIPGK
jgi:hypothetical protein